ncbi:MAG: 50S ribosomal protein L34e [Candidatus Hodarchaeaceae archaeon]|nr:50S ribosomal protein L34e [Candidatus Hodarchaeaceae archaeon]MDI6883654.1 50S ribosomal protein L34e [Hadesarchaea archaeon]
MPARRYRTKSYGGRRVHTPGGRVLVHYKEKRSGKPKCASCGRPLGGVPWVRASRLQSLPRSSRMPNRPFGGYLCPACTRQVIKEAARV